MRKVSVDLTLGELMMVERMMDLVDTDGQSGNTRLTLSEIMDVKAVRSKLSTAHRMYINFGPITAHNEGEKNDGQKSG